MASLLVAVVPLWKVHLLVARLMELILSCDSGGKTGGIFGLRNNIQSFKTLFTLEGLWLLCPYFPYAEAHLLRFSSVDSKAGNSRVTEEQVANTGYQHSGAIGSAVLFAFTSANLPECKYCHINGGAANLFSRRSFCTTFTSAFWKLHSILFGFVLFCFASFRLYGLKNIFFAVVYRSSKARTSCYVLCR